MQSQTKTQMTPTVVLQTIKLCPKGHRARLAELYSLD